jgi:diguanylate cyclase (GGDEF)-like protein/PAS domain S-box-containing protein
MEAEGSTSPWGDGGFSPLEQGVTYSGESPGPGQAGQVAGTEGSLTSGSALFDRVGALVIIFDRQGRILWCNRVCQEITGLTFQQVWGRHVWEVFSVPEEASEVRDVLADLRRDRFRRGYESGLVTWDGKERTIQWSTAPLPNGDGPVEHVVAIGVDITERKRAEDSLRQREEHYRRLVESSPDAIFVHHRGRMVFANRSAAVLLGASDPGEILGKPVLDFTHPDDRQVVEARLMKALQHDTELALVEQRLVRLDGSVVRVDAHSIFPFIYEGKAAVQVVAREVAQEQQVREEVSEEDQQKWETLLDLSPDAIVATDLRARITDVAQRSAEEMGFRGPDELKGKSAFELILAEDHEEFIKNLQKTFKEGVVRNIELALLKKDGTHFDAELDMALLREKGGKPKGFIIMASELSRRRLGARPVPDSLRDASESVALLAASRAVLLHREFEPAARAIFDACRKLIAAEAGYVGLMSEDGSSDQVLYSHPEDTSWAQILAASRPMRELRAEVYLTGKAMYLNQLVSRGLAGQVNVENLLFAPITVGENTVGLLAFANKVRGFSDEDARMASAFGQLAAVSLASSRAWEALDMSERRFRSVAEASGDAIVTFDSDEHIMFWNPGAEAMFGHSAEEMMGKRMTLVAPADFREATRKAASEVESGAPLGSLVQPVETIGRRKDGTTFPLEISFAGWNTRKGVFLTSILRDTTERKLAEHDLRLLADHDHLTGLPNRALFRDHLTQALGRANREPQRLVVLMIDLDHFKAINQEFGPQGGDQLLQAVGDRLTGLVRTVDTVARSGDDEFTLLLRGIEEAAHTDRVAERIRRSLKEPFPLNGREVLITVSMGAAVYPEDGDDVDSLIIRADMAMSQAKREGRDQYMRLPPVREGAEELFGRF